MKPDARLFTLWQELGEAIRDGDIQDLFVVHGDGQYNFGCAYRCSDLDDMLLQVKSEVIRIRCRREDSEG